jgi:hypothetical protein
MNTESTFNIIDQTEMFACFLNCNHIYTEETTKRSHINSLLVIQRNEPMKPAGNRKSVRTRPSIWIRRCLQIFLASTYVKAYFNRLRKKMINGRHSRVLCGPDDGFGAKTPPNLSSIQCLGA